MGIYDRARRSALTAICACSVVSGIGMTAAPGIALAKEKCAAITGAGSSLQATQQGKWVKEGVEERKFEACEPERPGIKYLSVGSGAGLAAYGIPGKVLGKVEGKSVAYVGTDDPPIEEEEAGKKIKQLKEAEEAGGTKLETVPTVAAPVAIILHPPSTCQVESTVGFEIPNAVLNKLWLSTFATWKAFLEEVEKDVTGFKIKAGSTCTAAIKLIVREDSSGTSFAFKQYLSQIAPGEWNAPGKEFVTDTSIWPNTPGEINKTGKGSSGEAKEVSEKEGAIGYVNLANAAEASPTVFTSWTASTQARFWAKIQNNGLEAAVKSAEPVKGVKEGNCPATLTPAQEAALPKGTANPPIWSGFHLATIKTAVTTVYPICTLTYDLGWNKYKIANLITYFGSEAAAVEAGRTVAAYFTYMVGTGAGKGQGEVASYYAPLPTKVDTVAKETVSSFVGK